MLFKGSVILSYKLLFHSTQQETKNDEEKTVTQIVYTRNQ